MDLKRTALAVGVTVLLIIIAVLGVRRFSPSWQRNTMFRNPLVSGLVSQTDLREIHVAAMQGDTQRVRQLLDQGESVSLRSGDGSTPLHFAAASGNPKMIDLLISSGGDIDAQNDEGATPVGLAIMLGMPESVEAILAHGPNMDIRDKRGRTPATLARSCLQEMPEKIRNNKFFSRYVQRLQDCEKIVTAYMEQPHTKKSDS